MSVAKEGMDVETDAEVNREIRQVWMVTREYDQLAGAGGVKDVCRQLAESLVTHGDCEVRVILPRYGFMDPNRMGFSLLPVGLVKGRINGRRYEHLFAVDMDYATEERRELVAIWQGEVQGVTVYLVEADRYATKRGVYTYTEEDEQEVTWQRKGEGHFDYFAMNILLQKAALDLMVLLDVRPEIIHCHDGHAATLPAIMREVSGYRHYFGGTGAVVTIHNAGLGYHQEVGDLAFAQAVTGLPERVILGARLDARFDPFLAAADYAVMNTVSGQYAAELQFTEDDIRTGWLGHTLLERGVHLAGVTNGIDPAAFDPTRPDILGLAAGFNVLRGELAGKQACKQALLTAVTTPAGWPLQVKRYGQLTNVVDWPLCTFIGRLTAQKGVDVLIDAMRILLVEDSTVQFAVFGSGAVEFEQGLNQLATEGPGAGRVCFLKGYDTQLANRVFAAGDFFLIPSLYEPCGLTDYMAQLMGNVPIVHRVGGLVKVVHGETGLSYLDNTGAQLAQTLREALDLYRHHPHTLRSIQVAAVERIGRHHTWRQVMDAYLHLYRQALPSTPHQH